SLFRKFNLLICSIIIFFSTFFCISTFQHGLMDKQPLFEALGATRTCLLILFTLGIMFLVWFNYIHYIHSAKIRTVKIITIVLFLLMAFIYVFMLRSMRILQYSDAMQMEDLALYLAKNPGDHYHHEFGLMYYSWFSNNFFLTIVYRYYFRFLLHFGVVEENLRFFLHLLNCSCLYLSTLFLFLTAKKVYGIRTAAGCLFLAVFEPTLYCYSSWLYSETISLPVVTFLLFLLCSFKSEQERWKKWLCLLLTGITTAVGFSLRATSIFVVPAIVVVLMAAFIGILGKKQEQIRSRWKRLTIAAALFLLTVCITAGSIHRLEQRFFPDTSSAFPMTHWVMIGSHEPGYNTTEDTQITSSVPDKESRVRKNLDAIKKNYQSRNLFNTITFWGKKLGNLFSDGYGNIQYRNIGRTGYSPLYHFISGNRSAPFRIYCSAYRAFTWLLILIAALMQIIKVKHTPDLLFLINAIVILGAIVFHCVWESKSDYVITFLPTMLFLAMTSSRAGEWKRATDSNVKKHKICRLCLGIMTAMLTIVLGIANYHTFCKDEFVLKSYSIREASTELTKPLSFIDTEQVAENNEIQNSSFVVEQSFTAEYSFDHIDIQIKETGNVTDDGECNLFILNTREEEILCMPVEGNRISGETLSVPFPTIEVSSPAIFTIRLEQKGTSQKYHFFYNDTLATRRYPGELLLNGKSEVNHSLIMSVYSKTKAPYLTIRLYVLLHALLIVLMIFLHSQSLKA
ncbi:MAG: glycosyltransferase family 39 protein, partial [Eubacteriales bacterium]|nr:glycosyltransferase family 39 protein [Eubacteriales bacterium]